MKGKSSFCHTICVLLYFVNALQVHYSLNQSSLNLVNILHSFLLLFLVNLFTSFYFSIYYFPTVAREYIACPDGGQVSLDWYIDIRSNTKTSSGNSRRSSSSPSTSSSSTNSSSSPSFNSDPVPIAVFIPGLTGDSQTEYIKSLIPHAQACGYTAVAFNNRGRGGMKLKTPKLYNAVDYHDLALALETIRAKHPKSKIIATGISLGGILLCRYLIEKRHEAVLDAAVLVSVCFDLQEGAKSMESQGLNLALNRHLAKSLISLVVEQEEMIRAIPNINYEEILASQTLRDFDERFTVKVSGYESALHYYITASNGKRVGDICIPTLCINAADDMFAPLNSLPLKEISSNPYTVMVVTHRGGHIGFMEGLLPFLPFYSERLLKQFYEAVLTVKNVRKELC